MLTQTLPDSWNECQLHYCLFNCHAINFFLSVCSPEDAASVDLMLMFPDLFGCVYLFANSRGWNLRSPVKEMFGTMFSSLVKPSTEADHVGRPVQESKLLSGATAK